MYFIQIRIVDVFLNNIIITTTFKTRMCCFEVVLVALVLLCTVKRSALVLGKLS